MDTRDIKVGSRIEHPEHGAGVVTFVGDDYLGITFDGSGEALIRRTAFDAETAASTLDDELPPRARLPWPESTFVPETPGTQHYLGSHWSPFVEDAQEMLTRLPEMLEGAMVQHGYSSFKSHTKPVPADWPKGHQLAWPPQPTRAAALIVAVEGDRNVFASVFPFFGEGIQHTVKLQDVLVWAGGLEAQITATMGPTELRFFDTRFVIDRAQYVAGRDYDFILAGIAYTAGTAKKHEWQIEQNAKVVAWMNENLEEGEEPHERQVTISMDGAAVLLPIPEWDIDDYTFHGPVKSVTEFKDWLGQSGSGWCAQPSCGSTTKTSTSISSSPPVPGRAMRRLRSARTSKAISGCSATCGNLRPAGIEQERFRYVRVRPPQPASQSRGRREPLGLFQ